MITIDKIKILDKLMTHKGFSKKTELANFLGIKPNVLSNWYSRNAFDEKVIIEKFPDISKIWLLTGEGEMTKDEPEKQEFFTITNDKDILMRDEKIKKLERDLDRKNMEYEALTKTVDRLVEVINKQADQIKELTNKL